MAGKGISVDKFKVEPFDGKNNFSLWQSTVRDILVQQGLIKALFGKEKKPASMSNDDWEELEMMAVSTIRLCLTPEVKYNVLNDTSAPVLWKKLENLYMPKSLTNKLFLKKQLYQLRMEEGTDIIDHLNVFNEIIARLLSVEVTIEEEDKALVLLASLPSTFDTLVTTLLVGKDTLKVDEVTTALLETETLRKLVKNSQAEGLVAKGESSEQRGRGKVRNSGSRSSSRSKSKGKSRGKFECYYCHKLRHLKRDCNQRKFDLKENNEDNSQNSDQASIAQDGSDEDGDI